MIIKLYFDGASKDNPGQSGSGYALFKDGKRLLQGYRYLGDNLTNNQAEWLSLIDGLKALNELGIENSYKLHIRGDSKLIVNQLTRKWRIKKDHLKPYRREAIKLLEGTPWTISWVPRESNTIADALSKAAIKTKGHDEGEHVEVEVEEEPVGVTFVRGSSMLTLQLTSCPSCQEDGYIEKKIEIAYCPWCGEKLEEEKE